MNKIYLICTVALFALLGCSQSDISPEVSDTSNVSAKIFNVPSGAKKGELLVKFNSATDVAIDAELASTKSVSGEIMQTGVANIDNKLAVIASSGIKRVFPIDNNRETVTRETGLQRWFTVSFSDEASLQEVAMQLASLQDVEKVVYVHTLKRGVQPKASPYVKRNTISRSSAYNDPLYSAQWNMKNTGTLFASAQENKDKVIAGADINVEAAWQKTAGTPEIIVAVLDEGVMYTHEDLKSNMWVNEGEEVYLQNVGKSDADGNGYNNDKYGYNFVFDRGVISWNTTGDTGHGTHVAGVVAATNNNGLGIAGVAGGSGNGDGVRIMSCQIYDGVNGSDSKGVARAIKYATDNGAVILQCSWGYNSGWGSGLENPLGFTNDEQWISNDPLIKEALDYFVNNAGSPSGVIDGGIAIFAAGNEYAAQPGYPGNYKDYIAVTATSPDYTPASYTNYSDGSDIAAPGGDADYYMSSEGSILSTVPPGIDPSGYAYMDGSSMACPHVSGVAALGLSYAYKLRKHFKWQDYKNLLVETCRSVDPYYTGTKIYYRFSDEIGNGQIYRMDLTSYRGKMGKGIVDAAALLNAIDGNGEAMKIPNFTLQVGKSTKTDLAQFIVDGDSKTYSANVANTNVATVSIEGSVITIKAESIGITTVKISAEGIEQTVTITVREKSGDNWL